MSSFIRVIHKGMSYFKMTLYVPVCINIGLWVFDGGTITTVRCKIRTYIVPLHMLIRTT